MNVFISYASEYRSIAEAIVLGLEQDGHQAFFDRSTLRAGDAFHGPIRDAIAEADLFVFLVSPESVEAGSYARTELQLARDKWPVPSGQILPVMAAETPLEVVPKYLTAVTLFRPHGDLVADVLAEIAKRAGRTGRRSRRLPWILAGLAIVLAAGAVGRTQIYGRKSQRCYLIAEVRNVGGGRLVPSELLLSVTDVHGTNTFLVSEDGSSSIHVGPFTTRNTAWRIAVANAAGVTRGDARLAGCPKARQELRIDDKIQVIVRPR